MSDSLAYRLALQKVWTLGLSVQWLHSCYCITTIWGEESSYDNKWLCQFTLWYYRDLNSELLICQYRDTSTTQSDLKWEREADRTTPTTGDEWEPKARLREQLKLKKTRSRSEIYAIRLPASTSHDSSFSCNSSRLVPTGLNGNCNSNSNGKRYYVTWQSTPKLSLEQSKLHYWARQTGIRADKETPCILKLLNASQLQWIKQSNISQCWCWFLILWARQFVDFCSGYFYTEPISIMCCQIHVSTLNCSTEGSEAILSSRCSLFLLPRVQFCGYAILIISLLTVLNCIWLVAKWANWTVHELKP